MKIERSFSISYVLETIKEYVTSWSSSPDDNVDLILTSGGTGFGERDNTPEAVKPLLHREVTSLNYHLLFHQINLFFEISTVFDSQTLKSCYFAIKMAYY